MQKLKVNDEVMMLSGKDKGKQGKVLKVFRKRNRVVVQGINILKKSVKATQESPKGGIVDKEGTVHISSVAIVSPKTKEMTKIKIERKEGKNQRVSVSCGTILP